MRREENAEGDALILCVNHACASNGGSNSDALRKTRAEEEAVLELRVRFDGYMRKIIIACAALLVLMVVVAYFVQLFRS